VYLVIRPNSAPTDITDHSLQTTFTGHKHNDYIKLIYMGARWYLPGVGRFISADTIVPYPTNPQSFNRFSYVRNNPLNFTDPTGHREIECDAGADCGGYTPSPPPEPEPELEEEIDDCLKPPTCEAPTTPWGPPLANVLGVSTKFFQHNNEAIDLFGEVGAELLAVGDGVVVDTGFVEDAEGEYVIIEYIWEDLPPYVQKRLRDMYPDEDFGSGKSIYVQYQHMMKGSTTVSVGDNVSAGQVVGNQGATGNTTLPPPEGEHLHIAVKAGDSGFLDGWYSDSFKVINPNVIWRFYPE
jgi:RHS repeat-associated protein